MPAGGLPAWPSALAFLAMASLVSYRAVSILNVPGPPSSTFWALADFRDAIYYPVIAFLHGHNPYDVVLYRQTYPVLQKFLYPPLALVVHLPFGFLPFERAELIYFVGTLALTLLLAMVTLRAAGVADTAGNVFGLGAAILASRPGQWTVVLGQVTLQMVIASYLALGLARDRPGLASLAVAFTMIKPTFGVPLAALMLARGDVRPVAVGVVLAAVPSLVATAVLVHVAGGIGPLIESLRADLAFSAYGSFTDVRALTSRSRIDIVTLVAHLAGRDLGRAVGTGLGLVVVGLGCVTVARLARRGERAGLPPITTGVVCMTMLLCTYHNAYDGVLLTLPAVQLALAPPPPLLARPGLRRLMLLLVLVPAVNYLGTTTMLATLGIPESLQALPIVLNAAALLVALVLYLRLAWQIPHTSRDIESGLTT